MNPLRTIALQLAASGLCCIASRVPFAAPTPVFVGFLLFGGIVVAGDSPQLSALNSAYAPRKQVGSALTGVNRIGFAITIASIGLLDAVPRSETQDLCRAMSQFPRGTFELGARPNSPFLFDNEK